MSSDKPAQNELLQKEIDILIRQCETEAVKVESTSTRRRRSAIGLKVIAGGSSIPVAAGIASNLSQAFGIAVLVAILVDTVTSNQKRLVAETKAAYAYRNLAEATKRNYNREAAPLVRKLKNAGDDRKAWEALVEQIEILQLAAQKSLTDTLAAIRTALQNADLSALDALSLDSERAGAQKPQ
jgi:thioesterase domain-containing protein